MKTFEELLKITENGIKNLNFPQQPENFYQPVKYILSLGGKRMRPVLTLMACNIFSEDITKALKPALGLEVFHNFTLLHDDIMDNSNLRRKQPTVNAKWGNNIAILSGDGMSYIASKLVSECPENVKNEVLDIFFETALEVCEGQQYDMDFETNNDVFLKDYIEMIRLKTAVLPAACLKIGALIGGADKVSAQKLYDLGIEMGIAFQLQDDYLDNYSTPEILGKPIGGDVNEGKKTVFYTRMIEVLENDKKQEWINFYNDKTLNFNQKFQKAKEYFSLYKVDTYCQDLINSYYDKAFKIFDEIKNSEVLKSFIEKLRIRVW